MKEVIPIAKPTYGVDPSGESLWRLLPGAGRGGNGDTGVSSAMAASKLWIVIFAWTIWLAETMAYAFGWKSVTADQWAREDRQRKYLGHTL